MEQMKARIPSWRAAIQLFINSITTQEAGPSDRYHQGLAGLEPAVAAR